jgi:hypothetical protein
MIEVDRLRMNGERAGTGLDLADRGAIFSYLFRFFIFSVRGVV